MILEPSTRHPFFYTFFGPTLQCKTALHAAFLRSEHCCPVSQLWLESFGGWVSFVMPTVLPPLVSSWETMVSRYDPPKSYQSSDFFLITCFASRTPLGEAHFLQTQELEGLDVHPSNGKFQNIFFASSINLVTDCTMPKTPISGISLVTTSLFFV